MENLRRAAGRWSVLMMGLLLAAQAARGQSWYPPPHDTDLDFGGPAKSGGDPDWTADWTSEETSAINEYMAANTAMREWIERSARPFQLGTVYGTALAKRLCSSMAVGEDWDCEDNETNQACYCNEDPACDPRLGAGPPNPDPAGCRENTPPLAPILDYTAFIALSAYDFNQCGVGAMSTQVPARRKDPNGLRGLYSFFAEDEMILGVGQANGQACTGFNVLSQLTPWIVHTVSTPVEMASVLVEHVETMISHYTGMNPNPVGRWVLANEMVPDTAPPVALDGAVSDSATTWTVSIAGSPDPLGAIPLPTVTIAGEIINGSEPGGKVIEAFALVDDEIVKITSRTGNSLTVVRGQAGTTAAAHGDDTVVYTLKGLVVCERDFWPDAETDEDFQPKYWLWRTLTDFDNGRQNDISDILLVDVYQRAHETDPDALLFYSDGRLSFAPMYGVDNQHFKNILALVRLLVASGAPLHGMSFHTHLPVWSCLTDDTGGEDGLRLNPKQLRGIVEGLSTFAQYVPHVIVSELDLRMGIPHWAQDVDELGKMHEYVGNVWENLEKRIDIRQKWQGYVYKAVIDAALAVPKVDGVGFWGTVDKHSWLNFGDPLKWPGYPKYPDLAACNADILGARIEVDTGVDPPTYYMVGHYYLKPAYLGVREAIADYFAPAFSVKDLSGNELVRFVNNGNVIVLNGPLHEMQTSWSGIGTANSFIVKDHNGDKVAVVEPSGEVFLAGEVDDELTGLSMPESGTAFIVKNHDGDVVSLIDSDGNLKARGKVIVKGVPYKLEKAHGGPNGGDSYSTYEG